MGNIDQTQIISKMINHYQKVDALYTELIQVSQQHITEVEKNVYISLHKLVSHRHVLIEQISAHEAVISYYKQCLQDVYEDYREFNCNNMQYMFSKGELSDIHRLANQILEKVNYLLFRDKIDLMILRKYKINLNWQRKCLIKSRKQVSTILHKPFFL